MIKFHEIFDDYQALKSLKYTNNGQEKYNFQPVPTARYEEFDVIVCEMNNKRQIRPTELLTNALATQKILITSSQTG